MSGVILSTQAKRAVPGRSVWSVKPSTPKRLRKRQVHPELGHHPYRKTPDSATTSNARTFEAQPLGAAFAAEEPLPTLKRSNSTIASKSTTALPNWLKHAIPSSTSEVQSSDSMKALMTACTPQPVGCTKEADYDTNTVGQSDSTLVSSTVNNTTTTPSVNLLDPTSTAEYAFDFFSYEPLTKEPSQPTTSEVTINNEAQLTTTTQCTDQQDVGPTAPLEITFDTALIGPFGICISPTSFGTAVETQKDECTNQPHTSEPLSGMVQGNGFLTTQELLNFQSDYYQAPEKLASPTTQSTPTEPLQTETSCVDTSQSYNFELDYESTDVREDNATELSSEHLSQLLLRYPTEQAPGRIEDSQVIEPQATHDALHESQSREMEDASQVEPFTKVHSSQPYGPFTRPDGPFIRPDGPVASDPLSTEQDTDTPLRPMVAEQQDGVEALDEDKKAKDEDELRPGPLGVGHECVPLQVEREAGPLWVEYDASSLRIKDHVSPLQVDSNRGPLGVGHECVPPPVESKASPPPVETKVSPLRVDHSVPPLQTENEDMEDHVVTHVAKWIISEIADHQMKMQDHLYAKIEECEAKLQDKISEYERKLNMENLVSRRDEAKTNLEILDVLINAMTQQQPGKSSYSGFILFLVLLLGVAAGFTVGYGDDWALQF